MNEKKQKLILDGNAFYEIDLECLKQKKEKEHREKPVSYTHLNGFRSLLWRAGSADRPCR